MIERYIDGTGVAFSDYRALLPKRAADFDKARPVKNRELLKLLHRQWHECMVCGRTVMDCIHMDRKTGAPWALDLHHIAHGGSGRSDEACNLAMLCSGGPDAGCHSDVHGGTISLGRLVYCRWKFEPDTTDWRRLAMLLRYFIPDLEER